MSDEKKPIRIVLPRIRKLDAICSLAKAVENLTSELSNCQYSVSIIDNIIQGTPEKPAIHIEGNTDTTNEDVPYQNLVEED